MSNEDEEVNFETMTRDDLVAYVKRNGGNPEERGANRVVAAATVPAPVPERHASAPTAARSIMS